MHVVQRARFAWLRSFACCGTISHATDWWREEPALRRYETFYDDAVDAVDELRSTAAAGADHAANTASTTEVTDASAGARVAAVLRLRIVCSHE